MKTELVHFLSTDNLRLPGLLFEPDKKAKKVVIYLHGNGSSSVFYSPDTNIFAKNLTKQGISFFPFNNRGAHYIKSLKRIIYNQRRSPTSNVNVESVDKISDNPINNKVNNSLHYREERVYYGTTYELIRDCEKDINGAIDFLKSKGYEKFYLMGASTGANKVILYHYYNQKNPVSKYILLAGGDDTGLYYAMLGKKNFRHALKRAQQEIEKGNGTKLIPKYITDYPLSWQSLFDTINPNGDYNIFPYNEYFNNLNLSSKELFQEYETIDKPTLVVYGENDEYCYGRVPECVEALKKHNESSIIDYRIIPETGHGFDGKEEVLARLVANWLSRYNN